MNSVCQIINYFNGNIELLSSNGLDFNYDSFCCFMVAIFFLIMIKSLPKEYHQSIQEHIGWCYLCLYE